MEEVRMERNRMEKNRKGWKRKDSKGSDLNGKDSNGKDWNRRERTRTDSNGKKSNETPVRNRMKKNRKGLTPKNSNFKRNRTGNRTGKTKNSFFFLEPFGYLLRDLAAQFQAPRYLPVGERAIRALALQHRLHLARLAAWYADALQLQVATLEVALIEHSDLARGVHVVDQCVLELANLDVHIVQVRIALDLVDRSVMADR